MDLIAFTSSSDNAKGHSLDFKSPPASEPDKEGPWVLQGGIPPAMESLQHNPANFSPQP